MSGNVTTRTSRPPRCRLAVRRASMPAILEEVVPASHQPDDTRTSCRNIGDSDFLQNSEGATIQPAGGNEVDQGATKAKVNHKLKKPFRKMASEPILGLPVDPGISGELLGMSKSVVYDQDRGKTPPGRDVPRGKQNGVDGGCGHMSRWGDPRTGDVRPIGGGDRRVVAQSVMLDESPVVCDGGVVAGASPRSQRRRLVWGVACLGLAFLLHGTASVAAAGLLRTVCEDLGTRAIIVQCAVLVASSALLPSLLLRYAGYKWTLSGSMVLCAPLVALQLWPREWALLAAAALVGVASAPLWVAKNTYVTATAATWARLTVQPAQRAQLTFFSVFYAIYSFSFVAGNTLPLLILAPSGAEAMGGRRCGPADSPSFRPPPQLAALCGVLLACIACAVLLVAVGVRHLHSDQEEQQHLQGGGVGSVLQLVGAAARLHHDPLQLLVAPLAAFTGLSQAFLNADFIEAYVSCSRGTASVGGVLACYGAAVCVASSVLGWCGHRLGHFWLVSGYGGCYCLLLAALFLWEPGTGDVAPFFLLAVFWGVADSGIPVVNSVCGILFRGHERAAYSNLRMWETVGFLYGYASSPLLCMRVKLAAMAALLVAALWGYWAAEWLARRRASTSFWLQAVPDSPPKVCSEDSQRTVL